MSNLLSKDVSNESGSGQSIDLVHYYLYKIPKVKTQNTAYNGFGLKINEQTQYSYEPLFLVKWQQQSYAQVTWEPLSALKGDNFDKVTQFLNANHTVKMKTRLQNQKNLKN